MGIMLSKVLEYLRKGGDANIATVSRKLDIDEGTIEMLFDQLIKLGYIEIYSEEGNIDESCTPIKCSCCSKSKDCNQFLKVKYRLLK